MSIDSDRADLPDHVATAPLPRERVLAVCEELRGWELDYEKHLDAAYVYQQETAAEDAAAKAARALAEEALRVATAGDLTDEEYDAALQDHSDAVSRVNAAYDEATKEASAKFRRSGPTWPSEVVETRRSDRDDRISVYARLTDGTELHRADDGSWSPQPTPEGFGHAARA